MTSAKTPRHGKSVPRPGRRSRSLFYSRWLQLTCDAARQATVRLFKSEDFIYASSIAYYALISLFPCLLFAVMVVGRFTDSESERAALGELVLQFVPDQVDLVSAELDRIASVGLGFGVVATIVIGWAALGVFRVISRSVNYAWDLEEPPGFLHNQLMAFVMLLASGVLLVLSLAWISVVEMVRSSWFSEVLEVIPTLAVPAVFLSRLPATATLVVVVGLIHYFVPATKVRLRDVWAGAVLTGVLWHLALSGFSWYLAEVANLSVHGSIGTVVAFLVWVYVSSVIFLFGVEYSAAWVRLQGVTREAV